MRKNQNPPGGAEGRDTDTRRAVVDDPRSVGEPLVLRTGYDWTEAYPTTAIVETVAEHTGTDVTELDPLYDHVPTDPLDAILEGTAGRGGGSPLTVTLRYAGFHVTVCSDGVVALHPTDD